MTGGSREGMAGMVGGSAEKLNIILASVGKRREVQERVVRCLVRTLAQVGNR